MSDRSPTTRADPPGNGRARFGGSPEAAGDLTAATDDQAELDTAPMLFFAVVPDAFMGGSPARSQSRSNDDADGNGEDRCPSPPVCWDRWSF